MRYFLEPQPSKSTLRTDRGRDVVRYTWHVRDSEAPIPFVRNRYTSAACSYDELTARRICAMLNNPGMTEAESGLLAATINQRNALASSNRKLLDTVATVKRERDQTQFMNAGMTVDRLRRDLDEANAALERHKTVADSCRHAAEEFERKYNAARDAELAFKAQAHLDRDRANEFKRKYDEMTLTAARAQTELAEANAGISTLTMDREVLRSERNRLRSQAEQLCTKVDRLESEAAITPGPIIGPVYEQFKRQILDEVDKKLAEYNLVKPWTKGQ